MDRMLVTELFSYSGDQQGQYFDFQSHHTYVPKPIREWEIPSNGKPVIGSPQ